MIYTVLNTFELTYVWSRAGKLLLSNQEEGRGLIVRLIRVDTLIHLNSAMRVSGTPDSKLTTPHDENQDSFEDTRPQVLDTAMETFTFGVWTIWDTRRVTKLAVLTRRIKIYLSEFSEKKRFQWVLYSTSHLSLMQQRWLGPISCKFEHCVKEPYMERANHLIIRIECQDMNGQNWVST